MRDNWEVPEAKVVTPNHPLQPQQRSMSEDRDPLPLSSMPDWEMAAETEVKEEPIDDKTSDSGVSPYHYSAASTSSNSRRSSTTNCSLSPDSAISNDSNMEQYFNRYSSEIITINNTPLDFRKIHLIENDSANENNGESSGIEQNMEISSNEMRSANEGTSSGRNPLQCPLSICSFTACSKTELSEHVKTHEITQTSDYQHRYALGGPYSCSSRPSTSKGAKKRTCRNSRCSRGKHTFDGSEEPGIRVPRVNSQGKIKTFICKSCNFNAITKLQFWDHYRGHIKLSKLLTCPKCPFVTEYKHHLEYHLRNHLGSKPFKCDKCTYTCVNKSMLNSHLKSHSNVYQYRCATCSYATKYLHSLKLHLRKYAHQPAMVLNPDGTPNPLPIIDVYGTRRGPKQKSSTITKPSDETKPNNNGEPSSANRHQQNVIPPQMSPPQASSSQMSPSHMSPSHTSPSHMSPPHIPPTMNPLDFLSSLVATNGINPIIALQYQQLFNVNYPTDNIAAISPEAAEQHIDHLRQTFYTEYARAIINERMTAELYHDDSTFNRTPRSNINAASSSCATVTSASVHASDDFEPDLDFSGAPLDLSKPHSSNNNKINTQNEGTCQSEMIAAIPGPSTSASTSRISRRKGRAYKLVLREAENDIDEISADPLPQAELSDMDIQEQEQLKKIADKNANNNEAESNNDFTCQFCKIAFGNEVMYTLHMGYHGYNHPFTCNMCGHKSDDSVSFFLHIARSKHA